MEENRLFISYGKEDLNEVKLIDVILRLEGIKCDYWDKSKAPGEKDWDQIENWIKRDRYFTVIVTENATKSSSVNQEIGYAVRSTRQIIPFQLERVDPRELGFLRGITPIDVTRDQLIRGARDLANAIVKREKLCVLEEKIRQIRRYLDQQAIEERKKRESEIFWTGVATVMLAVVIIMLLIPRGK